MRKILAIIMAVALVCSFALTASAAETTIADLTCEGHWTAWSEGVEITTQGFTLTMDAKTINGAANNWNAPQYIVYTNDTNVMFGDNFVQFYHERADIFGWDATGAATVTNALMNDWSIYLAKLAAGTKVTIQAIRVGDNVTVTMNCAGAISKITMPVTADKPAYLSLSGEQCAMTNIKVVSGIVSDNSFATSLDCSGGYRFNHTSGIEVGEKEVVITATSTSKAANNWNGLVWILFKGDMPVPVADTDIYWIERPDNYGWSPAGSLATDEVNAGNAAAMEAVGVTHEGTFDATWGSWENFVAAQQAGAKVTIAAKREGNVVTVTMQTAGISNKVTVPVKAGEPAYLSLSGDTAVITDITVTGGNKPPKTGDETMLLPAAIALVLSASALVVLKKKH